MCVSWYIYIPIFSEKPWTKNNWSHRYIWSIFQSLVDMCKSLYGYIYIYWGFIQIHNFVPRVPMWVNLINSCRTCLLCLLTLIQGGSYMVEQPGSSCMPHYKRFVWLSRVSKVAWHNYIDPKTQYNIYIYDPFGIILPRMWETIK